MLLQIKNTEIGYDKPLIKNISVSLNRGDICLIIGNNGIGKTSLIKSILNQIPIRKGEILVNNKNILSQSVREIAQQIAIVYSKFTFPDYYTTCDLISLGKYIHYSYYIHINTKDKTHINNIIEQLNLVEYKNTMLKKLSDGNLQKAFIGRALAQGTPFIILDEPITYLDETNKINILNILRNIAKSEGKTILFSSHDWRLAQHFVDKIWYLKNENLYSGIAEDIINQFSELASSPLLFSVENSNLPAILAPDSQREQLLSFLKKNWNVDFSKIQFIFENNGWKIEYNNKRFSAYTFSEIQDILQYIYL